MQRPRNSYIHYQELASVMFRRDALDMRHKQVHSHGDPTPPKSDRTTFARIAEFDGWQSMRTAPKDGSSIFVLLRSEDCVPLVATVSWTAIEPQQDKVWLSFPEGGGPSAYEAADLAGWIPRPAPAHLTLALQLRPRRDRSRRSGLTCATRTKEQPLELSLDLDLTLTAFSSRR